MRRRRTSEELEQHRVYMQFWRISHPVSVKKSRHKYRITHPLKRKDSSQRYYEKYPLKRKAHQAIWNAVHRHKIIKPKFCVKCGKEETLHGHHGDYSKPLNVRWLCCACHREEHSGSIE